MKNKYPTSCAHCYARVAVGWGTLIKDGAGWATLHDDCVESFKEREKELDEYCEKLRKEVLADSKCRDWLSAKGRYV